MFFAVTVPYARTSPVHIPRRDLVLSAADSLSLTVTVVESDWPGSLPIDLQSSNAGFGGALLYMYVWPANAFHHGWDYGAPEMHPGTVLWSGMASYSSSPGTFVIWFPSGTMQAWPLRCAYSLVLQWDTDGQQVEMLTRGYLHVPRTGRPAGLADIITPPWPGVVGDVGPNVEEPEMKNYVQNPLFAIAQRTAGSFNVDGYTLDRWYLSVRGGNSSIIQFAMTDTDRAQIGDESARWLLGNTFSGSAAADAYAIIQQRIEDVRRLAGRTVFVSFYAKASAALKFGVSLDQMFGTGGLPSAIVAGFGQFVVLSGVWQRYAMTFTLASVAGKSIGTDNNSNTALNFWYSAGSDDAANSGGIGAQSGTINLWGVQLETIQPGQMTPAPLEKPDPTDDLRRCQRYFQTGQVQLQIQSQAPGTTFASTASLPVTMRATPTTLGNMTTQTGATGGVMPAGPGNYQLLIAVTAATGALVNVAGSFIASAEL